MPRGHRRPWAYLCGRCQHLANVHVVGQDGRAACQFCDCAANPGEDFKGGVTQDVAKEQHADELAWIAKRWASNG